MGIGEFLELFIKELELNSELRGYYRLLDNNSRFLWRKAYLEQRLEYVSNHVPNKQSIIWDVGCGYATTSIFLALNGYRVKGNTLEYYYDKVSGRLDYWSRFGDLSKLHIEYANLYDMPVQPDHYDVIIAQDTLHHLEPIHEAFDIFQKSLKSNGRLIVTEENGKSPFIGLKNFLRRGFNRVNVYYDVQLKKNIPFGNENARSIQSWIDLLESHDLIVPLEKISYTRLYPPFSFNKYNYRKQLDKEKTVTGRLPLIRELLYFGINFIALKKPNT